MVQIRKLSALAFFFITSMGILAAQQTSYRGTALVVANYDYESKEDILSNPKNDGEAVADQLTRLGFKVYYHKNLSAKKMLEVVAAFGHQAAEYEIALFYYSGHGAQAECDEQLANYIIPVDVTVRSSDDVRKQCIDINSIATLFPDNDTKCKQKLFFIDACRNIPSFRIVSRSMARPKGGIADNTYKNTWTLYSTASNSYTDDGDNNAHSPFTTAWLEATKQPNLSLGDLAALIASYVQQLTNGQQQVSLNCDNPPSIILNNSQSPTSNKNTSLETKQEYNDQEIEKCNHSQLQTLAERGDARAQLKLAVNYYNGYDVFQDKEAALRWFREAALLGNTKAHYWLGTMYKKGEIVGKSSQKAAEHFRQGAMAGDPWAQYELAQCYQNGTWYEKNTYNAALWYNACAESNIGELQYYAASNLNKIGYDFTSLKWYIKAAENGYAKAQTYLGHFYFKPNRLYTEQGKSTNLPVNYTEAAKWFKKAAEQGDRDAINWYSICLEYGLGVPRNKEQSELWHNKIQ